MNATKLYITNPRNPAILTSTSRSASRKQARHELPLTLLRVKQATTGGSMRHSLLLVTIASVPLLAIAQDPVKTDSDKYKVLFENDCVRVLDYKDRPGDRTTQHKHPAFILYSLSSFQRSITLPDGKVLKRQFKEGDVMWSDSQTHIGENTGDTPTHAILVETKPGIGACAQK
jgi:hypothetical protein